MIDREDEESGDAYTLTLKQVANRPPAFGAGPLDREIAENSTSGTAVGDPVTADDPDDGDTLTYSLSGTDAASFTIDSGTGQISVASGTVLDFEAAKNTYAVVVGVSDGKDSEGTADTVVDTTITVNISVTNVNEGAPPAVDFTLSEIRASTMKVTVTPPDTTGTSPIKRYVVSYTNTSESTDFGIKGIESGTTLTLTGLTPSTTYDVRVLAHNMDGQNGPVTTKTVTTGTNTAPTSADFTKQVSRQTGATFSASDFPFTDADTGDAISKVKIVTLPDTSVNHKNRRKGELRFDGTAATAGQVIAVDDLGKLKYVPQPDGFRLAIESSFTFKVLDGDGAESPTYTVTLEQIADIVLTLSPDSITESSTPSAGGRVTLTATLTGPVRTADVVIPQIRVDIDHDARENSDYTVNNNAPQLTIPAGQKGATLTFDFTGIEDSIVEGDEEIRFYADWIVNGIFSSDRVTERVAPAYLTLQDNDRGVVAITGPPGEVEEGEDAVFTVSLSRGIAKSLTVAWSATAGTASAGDFLGTSGTVTFPDGSPDNATQTITIPITDDLVPEATERFSVTLGAMTGKPATQISIEAGKGTANADIAESDPVTVSISGDERVAEGDSATYTISLDSGESTQTITVNYTTTDKTAVAGTDYTARTSLVSFPPGITSASVPVETTENTDDEANRYFEFRISNPQGGGGPTPLLSTTQFVNTTIVDDDGDASSVTLSVDKASFGEGDAAGTVNVTATLEGEALDSNAIIAVTLGGTATKGSAGDYTATALGNITITGGETTGTGSFTVTPVNDEVVEGDETIELQGASAGLDVTPATITITDDDTATLGITGPAGTVAEGGNAEFTVTLSHAVASQVVVAWSAGSTAEVAASADDYSPDSGSVIFPAGSAAGATKTITMAIADDGADEQEETFTVTLGERHRRPVLAGVGGHGQGQRGRHYRNRRGRDGHPIGPQGLRPREEHGLCRLPCPPLGAGQRRHPGRRRDGRRDGHRVRRRRQQLQRRPDGRLCERFRHSDHRPQPGHPAQRQRFRRLVVHHLRLLRERLHGRRGRGLHALYLQPPGRGHDASGLGGLVGHHHHQIEPPGLLRQRPGVRGRGDQSPLHRDAERRPALGPWRQGELRHLGRHGDGGVRLHRRRRHPGDAHHQLSQCSHH